MEGRRPHADRRRHGRLGNPGEGQFQDQPRQDHIDSPSVPGWNEIDAVGLHDKNKKMHWAVAAEASPPTPRLPAGGHDDDLAVPDDGAVAIDAAGEGPRPSCRRRRSASRSWKMRSDAQERRGRAETEQEQVTRESGSAALCVGDATWDAMRPG